MPQLDYTLLFNQVFWLFLFFITLYIIIIYFFLPNLLKIFQTRKQFFLKNKKEIWQINKNLQNLNLFYKKLILNCNQVSNSVSSATFFLRSFEKSSLKSQLFPSAIIHFISSKILFHQIYKSTK